MSERGDDQPPTGTSPWSRASADRQPRSRRIAAPPQPESTAETTSAAAVAHAQRRRERRGIVAWLAVVLLGFGAVAIVNSTTGGGSSGTSDGDTTRQPAAADTADSTSTSTSPPTAATDAGVATSVDDHRDDDPHDDRDDDPDVDHDDDPGDDVGSSDDGAVTEDETDASDSASSVDLAPVPPIGTPEDAQWSSERVRFPTWNLLGPEPFQLLLLDSDGVLHELTFPAGTHRTIKVAPRAGGAEFAMTDEFTLVMRWETPDAFIVHDDGVLRLPMGDWRVRASTPAELVGFWMDIWHDGPARWPGDGPVRFTLVGGMLEPVDYDPSLAWDPGSWEGFAPDGAPIMTDGGSVYQQGADGAAERISTGEIVTFTPHHVVLHECDEHHRCELVALDRNWRRRTYEMADVIEPFEVGPFGNWEPIVSPDGNSIVVAGWVDFDERRTATLVNFDDDGTVTSSFELGTDLFEPQVVWLPDSSAVIVTDRFADVLHVVQRDDGHTTWWDFRINVVAVAVRGTSS